MPKPRHRCKECGGREDVVGRISRRGLCMQCGWKRYNDAQTNMIERRGPIYDAYVAAWIKSAGFHGRPTTPHAPDA